MSSNSMCVRCALVLASCMILAMCTIGEKHVKHATPRNYVISGLIHHEPGMWCKCRIELRSDTALIKNGDPDPTHGSFTLALTLAQAQELRKFHIFDSDGALNEFYFDRDLLKDSLIAIDFQLKVLPRNYRVIMGVASHSSVVTYDTVWTDLNGYPVSKVVSDSLWRDIPHK
mgnify:CR=1 FL=1